MRTPLMRFSSTSFLKHATIYGLGAIATQIASVVLLPLYTRYLSPADFGVLEILSRTGQIISIVLLVNSISVVTFTFYCQSKTTEQRETTAATLSCLLAGVMIPAGMLVVFFARPLGVLVAVDNPQLTALGILVGFMDCTTMIPMCLMQARTESTQYVVASLASFVCRVMAITVAVVAFGMGIWGVLWASIATSAAIGAILNLRELWGKPFRFDSAVARQIMRFAVPFLPSGLCFFLISSSDRFFLVKTCGQAELGIYALGCKLAGAVSLFSFTPLFKVWSVRMYDAFAGTDAAHVVGQMCTRLLGCYIFVATGLCVFIDDVLAIFASPKYASSAAIVPLLALAGVFSTVNVLLDGPYYAHRRTGIKPWVAFFGMIAMCGFLSFLIPLYGSSGAATASACGYFCMMSLNWLLSQRVFRVAYEYKRLAIILGSAIVVVGIARQIHLGLTAIPLKASLMVGWVGILFACGVISDAERSFLKRTIANISRRIYIFGKSDKVSSVPSGEPVIPPERVE